MADIMTALTPEELAIIEKRRAKLKKRRVSRMNQLRNALKASTDLIATLTAATGNEVAEVIEARRVLALTAPKKRAKKAKAQAVPEGQSDYVNTVYALAGHKVRM